MSALSALLPGEAQNLSFLGVVVSHGAARLRVSEHENADRHNAQASAANEDVNHPVLDDVIGNLVNIWANATRHNAYSPQPESPPTGERITAAAQYGLIRISPSGFHMVAA